MAFFCIRHFNYKIPMYINVFLEPKQSGYICGEIESVKLAK